MIKSLYEKFIVAGYVDYGMIYGDIASYACAPGIYYHAFKFFEKRYIKLGYKPIPFDEFITAGGYVGKLHLMPYIRQRNDR